MLLLRFPKTFEQTHKIKIGKSLKRVDSDCIFGVLDFTLDSFTWKPSFKCCQLKKLSICLLYNVNDGAELLRLPIDKPVSIYRLILP